VPGPLTNGVEAEGTSPAGTVVNATNSATVAVIDPNPPTRPSNLYLPLMMSE
jgi:hypothetical protein